MNRQLRIVAGLLALGVPGALALSAQTPPAGERPQHQRPGWDREPGQGPPPMHGMPGMPGMGPHGEGGPGGRGFHGGPASRWWMDARMAQRVGLTDEQKKRMDAVFQPSRLKLIDLTAALQREEAILEPLLAVDQPEDAQVLPQLDRVVQARGELEKARAKMLLGFRRVLTPEQWKKLQHGGPPAPPPPPGDRR